jgi:nicotinamidase-related amidase
MASIAAQPYSFDLDPARAALLIIDMQRDFLEPNGYGAVLGNDPDALRCLIAPIGRLRAAARGAGMLVIHTREGHRPDLADLPPAKRARGQPKIAIGDPGPMGRLLVRGEAGHAIVDELAPASDEPVIDKPGKGAFYATDLESILRNRGIRQLVICGVTTEVCVQTTLREANDRGYDCVVVADATGSYFPRFHQAALDMIVAQGGIFGWVAESAAVIAALATDPAGPAINAPDAWGELREMFYRYEVALVAGDFATLADFFWRSPHIVRYGLADQQHGREEIVAYLQSQRAIRDKTEGVWMARDLARTTLTTFGRDSGTASTLFRLHDSGRTGRQMQTWIRMAGRWQIVAAHVSFLDFALPP